MVLGCKASQPASQPNPDEEGEAGGHRNAPSCQLLATMQISFLSLASHVFQQFTSLCMQALPLIPALPPLPALEPCQTCSPSLNSAPQYSHTLLYLWLLFCHCKARLSSADGGSSALGWLAAVFQGWAALS